MSNQLQVTTFSQTNFRADFNKSDFETLIDQKGRDVLLDKAIQCPCKSRISNHQSICQNCGGNGWFFINSKQTKMVIQGMNAAKELRAWSEEYIGAINISCKDTEELTYMDRIIVLNAKAINTQVLHFNLSAGELFAYSAYFIKEIKTAMLFKSVDTKHQLLTIGTDITFDKNIVKLSNLFIPTGIEDGETELSVTLRYVHAPTYHIWEMRRESIESFEYKDGKDKMIRLPLSAIAKRAQYLLNPPNLDGSGLLDNSYKESTCQ